jgi:ABC-2 type transport system ATP-binding protein
MIGAVQIHDLSKTYLTKQRKGLFRTEKHAVEALQNISLEVIPGEIFGLLGPNGAGKTTLIKILTTLLLPTSGDAWLNGHHIQNDANKVRASVGCMLMGERGLYWKLTGRENLEYFGALYHLPPSIRKARTQQIIDLLEMNDLSERTVETYSSGQKMKLAFGKALVNDAPLLILDEPTNTLDVPSASELRAIVRDLRLQGKTIIYTTHIMTEAETLCDRVAIIDYGKLLAVGTVDELKNSLERSRVIRVEGVIPKSAAQAVRVLPGIQEVTLNMVDGCSQMTVVSDNGSETLPRIFEALTSVGATIQRLAPEEITLEDVFIAKTGRTLAEDTRTK